MKSKVKKVVSKAIREKAEEVITGLKNCPNGMFGLVKGLKPDSKDFEGGKCMRGRMESCVSVRRKEVKSGRIMWKAS